MIIQVSNIIHHCAPKLCAVLSKYNAVDCYTLTKMCGVLSTKVIGTKSKVCSLFFIKYHQIYFHNYTNLIVCT
jgi:hypothetical protein